MRLGDVDPSGRLRFDALTRYTQDVSNDDTRDAALVDALAWVVRKTAVDVIVPATFDEELTFVTFCSGLGRRWAERRLHVTGSAGARYEVATLWIHLDEATGRPKTLSEQFLELYSEAADGREVSARLSHERMPDPAVDSVDQRALTAHQWPLRSVDFDTLGHMNNAAYWAAVEQMLELHPAVSGPMRAVVEYGAGIAPASSVELRIRSNEDGWELWWSVEGNDCAASATVTSLDSAIYET